MTALHAANRGRRRSAETRLKMRQARLRRLASPEFLDEFRKKMEPLWSGRRGVPLSPETREKLRVAATGKRHSAKTRAKISAARIGKHHSPEARAKMTGRRHSAESRARISAEKTGKKHPHHWWKFASEEKKAKFAKKFSGSASRLYVDGRWRERASERQAAFKTSAYKEWRRAVFSRDNYTCVLCGSVGGELHADHIQSWRLYPDLRYSVDNGRTLCAPCHRKTPNYGGRERRLTQAQREVKSVCHDDIHPP